MFNLDKHDASISNVNFRKENHGDEKAAAADITLKLQASSTLLDSIDPELRKRFFKKPGKGEQQALPIDGNNLTALAMPYLGEQKIGHEFDSYEVEFAGLLDHIEPLFLADAKVKKLSFTPVEGGSINLSLTVSTLLADEDDAPLLAAWRRGEVRLTLTPPSRKGSEGEEGAQAELAKGAPVNDEGERCESDAADCGPVAHHDTEGVPLCQRCWDELPALDDEDPEDPQAANDPDGAQSDAA